MYTIRIDPGSSTLRVLDESGAEVETGSRRSNVSPVKAFVADHPDDAFLFAYDGEERSAAEAADFLAGQFG